jgi:hypothetical protein
MLNKRFSKPLNKEVIMKKQLLLGFVLMSGVVGLQANWASFVKAIADAKETAQAKQTEHKNKGNDDIGGFFGSVANDLEKVAQKVADAKKKWKVQF